MKQPSSDISCFSRPFARTVLAITLGLIIYLSSDVIRGRQDLIPGDGMNYAREESTTETVDLSSIPTILPVSLKEGWVSSPFGIRTHPIRRKRHFHTGVDLAVYTGTRVRAAAAGLVTHAGRRRGYGLLVEIDHGNFLKTRYGHLSRIRAKKGDRVAKGEVIAFSGNTGTSTGPHLHYEVRRDNRPQNPDDYHPAGYASRK